MDKEEQKRLITEIMNEDAKDGLYEPVIGQRIELIEMVDDPQPIEPGTQGTVTHIGGDVINVDWDNGRTLGVVMGVDKYKTI